MTERRAADFHDGEALLRRLRAEDADFAAGYAQGEDVFEAIALLHSFLERSGKNRKDVAAALGVSSARITQALRGGGRDGPSYAFIKRFARACGIDWPGASATEDAVPAEDRLPSIFGLPDAPEVERGFHRWLAQHSAAERDAMGRTTTRLLDVVHHFDPEHRGTLVVDYVDAPLEGDEVARLLDASGTVLGEVATIRTRRGGEARPVLLLPLEHVAEAEGSDENSPGGAA